MPLRNLGRTYGRWWDEAPSRNELFMPQSCGGIISQDFIDLEFEQAVYPFRVCVYETYNPGSVVRIWAEDSKEHWELLWEGEPQCVGHTSRIFSPDIKSTNFPTKVLRLEFSHAHLDYYTELDAVLLVGTKEAIYRADDQPSSVGKLTSQIMQLNIHTIPPQVDIPSSISSFLDHQLPRLLKVTEDLTVQTSDLIEDLPYSNFNCLPISRDEGADTRVGLADLPLDPRSTPSGGCEPPDHIVFPLSFSQLLLDADSRASSMASLQPGDEAIVKIFGYLDLLSLCKCSQVNRQFHRLAADSLLYTELNLKVYWYCTTAKALSFLTPRCKYLQKLDLSWCGNILSILPNDFIRFIDDCGGLLTHIRLNSCKFANNASIIKIGEKCKSLKELSLGNCLEINEAGFWGVAELKCLERLDLYHTLITLEPLKALIVGSSHLVHINLGSCVQVSSMDEIAQALALHCRDLVSVDFWKTYSLTPVGVRSLSMCSKLQEVDFGWCLGVGAPGNSLHALAKGCPRIKKLFLAALRGVGDRDLEPFMDFCPNMEQIDLVGVRSITSTVCMQFLTRFPRLRLLDVSFCDQILDSEVSYWQFFFPHVSIKRSFQHEDRLPQQGLMNGS
uniref:F-box/LRR-repeat protein 4 n=1 Tax=Timema poppense TaxID=170557 RepID=A0A7R9GYQ5_TIMPO|nr:unnamed protein product [Timema poppensis]